MPVALRPTFVALAACLACATSPTGRQQLLLFPEAQMTQMGVAAYAKLREQTPVSDDLAATRRVRCVADAITARLEGAQAAASWEVTLFEEPTPNAFALPGGKMGVHTGLLRVARDQHQLATVLGHEVAHVIAGHANERVSTTFATQTGLQLVQVLAGAPSATQSQLLALLGVGAQVGVILPFSRAQEREADLLGLDLMAKAGFDPQASIPLWRNMSAAGGAGPPEFLSTHPSHGTRIQDLEAHMPAALRLGRDAHARGLAPACD
jgi:predicted Zn-dependent protease